MLLATRYRVQQVIGKGESATVLHCLVSNLNFVYRFIYSLREINLTFFQDTFRNNESVAIKVLHAHNSQLGPQETDIVRRLNLADPHKCYGVVSLKVFIKCLKACSTLSIHSCFFQNAAMFDDHYCLVFEHLQPKTVLKHELYGGKNVRQ